MGAQARKNAPAYVPGEIERARWYIAWIIKAHKKESGNEAQN